MVKNNIIQILKNRSVLHVTGKDTVSFLQSLVTNDVVNIPYSYNYLLSSQGRYLFDFFILRVSKNEVFIEMDSSSSRHFVQTINLYKFNKTINIEDITDSYYVLYSKKSLRNHDKTIYSKKDPRFDKLGFRSLIKKAHINEVEINSNDLYLLNKYYYTIPDGECDLKFNRSMVMQFGAEQLSAISFTKGCYIGQEAISRTKYQGGTRKGLYKITYSKGIPKYEYGVEVMDLAKNKAGIFCSSYQDTGIALVSHDKYLEFEVDRLCGLNYNELVLIYPPKWRK